MIMRVWVCACVCVCVCVYINVCIYVCAIVCECVSVCAYANAHAQHRMSCHVKSQHVFAHRTSANRETPLGQAHVRGDPLGRQLPRALRSEALESGKGQLPHGHSTGGISVSGHQHSCIAASWYMTSWHIVLSCFVNTTSIYRDAGKRGCTKMGMTLLACFCISPQICEIAVCSL